MLAIGRHLPSLLRNVTSDVPTVFCITAQAIQLSVLLIKHLNLDLEILVKNLRTLALPGVGARSRRRSERRLLKWHCFLPQRGGIVSPHGLTRIS